ncbi:YwqG family protein [Shewanella sp. 38A_GOM-205m]|uniref:YwqG family protein n=1 Tax=Shewanella sp. 38A_GOM-205m TaxID=1380363 RepID=UPI00048A7315|nr:YwqG family protein [Shewanella sp. 38A_GOM-205m]
MIKDLVAEDNLQNHIKLLEELASPCVYGVADGSVNSLGCSKVGGLPHADKDFIWPKYKGVPLEFVVQLNLNDLEGTNLPDTGLLLFFYANGVWTDKKMHKDFFRVIHVHDMESLEVKEPKFKDKKRLFGLLKSKIMPLVFDEYGIGFYSGNSLPDLDNVDTIPSLSLFDNDDELLKSYCDLKWGLSEKAILQIGGYPNPVQYDGIAAGAASIIEKGAANDWELLLEVDSKLGFMWGDAGRLYFYIHKDDLKTAKFADVWMEFQCH